jgi:succinate dehydrogenase/fumarate reductase flavoprotein subunit
MKKKSKSNITAGRQTIVRNGSFSSISPLTTLNSQLFFKVAIIGSGAASLNAAIRLKRFGIEDIAIITEGVNLGTSANTGSDKQTYYRLNPCAPDGDSAYKMAQDLFSGGAMHGDTALIEAALSSESFAHLCFLGVEFPFNEYNIYPGYRTDHDTASRATSAGPCTSIVMHEKLLAEAKHLCVTILDGMEVVKILTGNDGFDPPHPATVRGVVALDSSNNLNVILSDYVVWGTGGPAALYADSAYPREQTGTLGVALMAGARACNLTESQFGISSVNPRWNLSGSFQQVLPDYFSCNADGKDKRHFLADYFEDWQTMCGMIFLKGYEWPFDVRKLPGSSMIDLLVYRERVELGRKVYMDFTSNPVYPGRRFSTGGLPDNVKEYLEKSGSDGATPVKRLIKMNPSAYELYLSKGVDLKKEPLEIAVCNQHLNGGLAVDKWWETSVKNLFAVGEAAGTHGIYRPGGSALNAGQVGSLRAAMCIAHRIKTSRSNRGRNDVNINEKHAVIKGALESKKLINLDEERLIIQKRASSALGIIRSVAVTKKAMSVNAAQLQKHLSSGVKEMSDVREWLKNIDLLITERAMLDASIKLLESLGQGRGSFIYREKSNQDSGYVPTDGKSEDRLSQGKALTSKVIETWIDKEGNAHSEFVPVRPVPKSEDWFETVWARFKKGEVFES